MPLREMRIEGGPNEDDDDVDDDRDPVVARDKRLLRIVLGILPPATIALCICCVLLF